MAYTPASDRHPLIVSITDALQRLSAAQDRTVSDYMTLSSELLLEAGMDPARMDEVRGCCFALWCVLDTAAVLLV
jgi:hypothetical protein